jgi:hypothetical protein
MNAHDVDALVTLCDREIEVHSVFAAVSGAVYQGHAGVRRGQHDLADTWGDAFQVEPEEYFDLREHTLVFGVIRGRGEQSGVEVEMPAAAVAKWRNGLCVYFKGYVNREDALKELRVSQEALEPIAP